MSAPFVETYRDRIRSVAERFKAQYGPQWRTYSWGDSRAIYERLCALDVETATLADVQAAGLSRGGWVAITCDGCGEDVEAVVVVGQPEDYESATAKLCRKCLADAVRVFAEVPA